MAFTPINPASAFALKTAAKCKRPARSSATKPTTTGDATSDETPAAGGVSPPPKSKSRKRVKREEPKSTSPLLSCDEALPEPKPTPAKKKKAPPRKKRSATNPGVEFKDARTVPGDVFYTKSTDEPEDGTVGRYNIPWAVDAKGSFSAEWWEVQEREEREERKRRVWAEKIEAEGTLEEQAAAWLARES